MIVWTARLARTAPVSCWLALVIAVNIVGAFPFMTGIARPGAWYAALEKPPLTPPDIAFAIAWPVLFTLMATALWRLLRRDHPLRGQALSLFAVQLFVNILWTPTVFALHSLYGGVVVILALLAVLLPMIRLFARVDRPAGLCLLPYLAWTLFALYLTVGLVLLN